VKHVPDLSKTQLCPKFAEGKCDNPNCTYAHGEADLRDPPNFKKKICKWHQKGKCRNGSSCGFAHDVKELREIAAPPGFESAVKLKGSKNKISAPPGLEKMGVTDDCDASTAAPSSDSTCAETDVSMAGMTAVPNAQLFHLQAARGSAPLQQQVSLMSSAIGGLQAKLSALEDMMLQNQVLQMQQSIQQLSEQCWSLEAGLCMAQPSEPTPLKSRLSAKAAPFQPAQSVAERSDDSTSVGSERS